MKRQNKKKLGNSIFGMFYGSAHTQETFVQKDYLSQLSPEVLLHIFSFLPTTSLALMASVSKNMKTISEDNNLWKPHCPKKFRRRSAHNFKELYKELSQSHVFAKIVVVGGVNCEKTLLLKQHVHGIFSRQHKSTIGVDISKKSYTRNVTVQFWDLAGQERFNGILPTYCREAHCAIAVLNLHQGAAAIEQTLSWIHFIQVRIEKIPVALILTYDGRKKAPIIPANEVLDKFSENYGIFSWIIVDYNNKNKIDLAFEAIIKELADRYNWFMEPQINSEASQTVSQSNCLAM
jgi:GTPase SAR1 family protein